LRQKVRKGGEKKRPNTYFSENWKSILPKRERKRELTEKEKTNNRLFEERPHGGGPSSSLNQERLRKARGEGRRAKPGVKFGKKKAEKSKRRVP